MGDGATGGGMRVVLVGHCGPDMAMLTMAVRAALPGAVIVKNTEEKSLWDEPAGLYLVNRVLDGWYTDESGLRLIGELAAKGLRGMLISNYPEAQRDAVAAGGCPGFGKSAVRSDEAVTLIREAAASEEVRDADA